jgi:hypothetical protein
VIRRRELLIQRMQRLNIIKESYLRYVTTINETFEILKRTIEPYYYRDNVYITENQEASNVQGMTKNEVSDNAVTLLLFEGFSFTPRNRLFLSIGMCTSQNKAYKVDMEDTMKFIDCFGMDL